MPPANARSLTPHADSDRLGRALERCLAYLAPWSGVMYRATGIDYANHRDLLSGVGSMLHGARWTPRGSFPAVYGSLDPQAALLEALGTGARYGIPYEQRMPLVMVAVDVRLERVLDLTLPAVRRTLRLSRERMLAEDWEATQQAGDEALTQAVARLARERGIQGLFTPSARLKGQKNLVVFPDTLRKGALKVQNVEKLPEAQ
jgi:RES domain-containing protein